MNYQRKAERERIVFLLPKAELEALDRWAIPAGIPNRSEAIRQLLRTGIASQEEAETKTQKADAGF